MNRRQLLQLSLMATLAPAGQLHAAPKARKGAEGSPKKGLCIGTKDPDYKDKLEALRCKWFYNWTGNIPQDAPRGVDYFPMIWKYAGNPKAVENIADAAKRERIKELLGFNEPDASSQANMSVEQAINAWPILEKTELRLGSPGCVHPDNEWMKEFMGEVKKHNLRVDFICVHSYGGPNADALIDRLEAVHKLYKRPIWITEFAVADWKAQSLEENKFKPDEILDFMKEVLPKLDRKDFIERYAWFPAATTSIPVHNSALWDEEGKLTKLGECYRDH